MRTRSPWSIETTLQSDDLVGLETLPHVQWTRIGRVSYALFWLVYGLGFMALDWIRDGGPAFGPALRTCVVLIPAALLGVLVVAISNRVEISRRRWHGWFLHTGFALAFPAVWIAIVFIANNLVLYSQTGVWAPRLAPSHVLHWHYLSGVLMYITLGLGTYGLRYARAESIRRQRAELEALRTQLSPHFLFNALHTLFALSRTEPDSGEAGISRLAALLRYSLRERRPTVPLGTDWGMCEEYLRLEQLRFGDRLQWHASFDADTLQHDVPPFLIQPLLENAVHHAVQFASTVTIAIRGEVREGALVIQVSDDGPGSTARPWSSDGVGLRSIVTRLRNLPKPGSLAITTSPQVGFSATISLPLEE